MGRFRPIFWVLLTVCLGGCGKPDTAPIRLGMGAWPGFEFLYLAQVKGFFKEENVQVQLVEFSSVSDSVKAFERGQVDGFGSTLIELLLAHDRGARLPQAFYVTDISEGADVIIARNPIASIAELKGRKVGLEFGSMNIYLLVRALEGAGMGLGDIRAVSVDQGSIFESFQKGEIDAAVTWPPASNQILDSGQGAAVFSSKEIPDEVVDVLISDPEFLKSHPREMAAVARAFEKAVAYSKASAANRTEAYAIMAAHQHDTPENFAGALEQGLRVARMSDQPRFFEKSGLLERNNAATHRALRASNQLRNPINYDAACTGDIVRAALPARP